MIPGSPAGRLCWVRLVVTVCFLLPAFRFLSAQVGPAQVGLAQAGHAPAGGASAGSRDGASTIAKADQLYDARNYAAALALYRKAADAGQPHALARVGLCYNQGFGVKEDDAEALRYLRRAADAGDLDGMAYLGGMYANGYGVPVDMKQALFWYHKSADAGGAAGMNKLGLLYQNGNGVPRDPATALRWYLKAAGLGDMYAMNNLANMYLGLSGVPKNNAESLRWYTKAAVLGDADSMVMLGHAYEHGELEQQKDQVQARAWYQKAAATGNENAKESLLRFGKPSFDLTGIWEGYYTTPAIPEAIRIVQSGGKISAERLRGDLSPSGVAFIRGTYDGEKVQGQIEVAQQEGLGKLLHAFNETQPTAGLELPAHWVATTLYLEDPDHIHVGKTPAFQRVTPPAPNDLHCNNNGDNSQHVKPVWAYIRGKQAFDAANYQVAVCWFHIGVVGGEPRSMTWIGTMVREGLGTDKNPAMALSWFQQSAQAGDPAGAKKIAEMYDRHEIPANAAQSQLWHTKARDMQAQQDRLIAEEKKKEAQDKADMQLIGGVANVGLQLLTWDVGADPKCDVRRRDRSGSPISDSVDSSRAADKEALLERGEIYCGRPIDLSPLIPKP